MKKTIKRKKASRGTQKTPTGLAAKVALVEKSVLAGRGDVAEFSSGDTVKVHVRIKEGDKERIQIYEGVVISKNNRGASKSFTVRKISHGVGVERVFLESSPKVAKVEIVQEGKVRRSKLYYLRALEGKAARIERDVDASTSQAAPAKKS